MKHLAQIAKSITACGLAKVALLLLVLLILIAIFSFKPKPDVIVDPQSANYMMTIDGKYGDIGVYRIKNGPSEFIVVQSDGSIAICKSN